MSKLFKIVLFSACLAVTATAAVPALPGAALAATYTAPPAQSERAVRPGQPITDPSRPPAEQAAALRANTSAGPASPVYLEDLRTGGTGESGGTVEKGVRLAEHAYFLLDPAGSLTIEQAGSPAKQNSYTRLLDGIPLTGSGAFWLRFSLAGSGPTTLQPAAGPALRLEPGTPPARMYVAQEFARNGDVRRWREIAPAPGGVFRLPDPRGLPLTVYMKFDGVPGLWFNPQLTAAGAGPAGAARYLPLAAQIVLGLSVLALLLRGLAGGQEWRLWGAAVLGCALVQALFCRQSPELGSVYLTALPPLLAPGLLVMLMPHLGRHLLQSRERRLMDFLLIILSLPGAAAALLPLVPGLGWSAKFLPLAPLLLLPLLFVAAAALSRRRPGSTTYFLICLLPLLGALLALLGLGLAEARFDFNNALYRLGPNLASYGYAATALVMVFSGQSRGETREDFFPLEISTASAFNAGGAQDLKLYAADALPELPDLPESPPASVAAARPQAGPATLREPPLSLRPSPPLSESFPLDEDDEPVLRLVRLYTPEPAPLEPELADLAQPETPAPDQVLPTEQPEPAQAPARPLEAEASANASADASDDAGETEKAGETAPVDAAETLAAAEEIGVTWAALEARQELLPEAQPGPPVAPVPELPEETPFEEPADGPEQEAEIPVPPARPVEDATGPLPPFNLAEAVRYKDKEEPGLVIIKPEPPFPLVNSKKEAEAEKNGRTEDLILAAEADELLELTELVIPTAGPIARPIAEMAEAPENALATTPEEPAETIQALDQPPAGQYAAADTPVSFLAGLAEILPESASDATPKTLDPVEDADDALSGLDEALNCLDRLARAEAVNKADLRVFNLSSLVRRLHAETVELAESRGIALSWFVSPSLDLLYKGDEKTLRLTLGHMLRGAVESARDGAIQLAVRPAPEGADLLRFSLTDSALTPDSPRPPARLLSRAWELACASQGSFSIEFVPERGTSINFSLRLKPLEDEDYIEAAQSGFRPELRRTAGPNAAPAADARPPIRRLDEMTGLAEPAAGLAGTGDLDGPLDAAVLDGVALSSPAAHPVRDSIVIADPADSGRRLIARRLGGLPYARIEAASLREAVQACSWGNVALVILDGELAADEVGQALASIEAEGAAAGRPPVPSLCLLSHMSQCERLLKAGCTACQVKSENREEFQALVQSLTTEELRSPAQFNAGPGRFDSSLEEPEPSVSMLDMIVSSLDSESAELEKGGDEAPERNSHQTGGQAGQAEPDFGPGLGAGFGSGALTRLSGAGGEYMASAMVPMIPGFLDVMREDLRTLEDGVAGMKFAQVQEVTARMQSRSRTYGLSNLERMAACVERAAQAKDREAVNDLAEELALMCRRYLNSLRKTHDNASK